MARLAQALSVTCEAVSLIACRHLAVPAHCPGRRGVTCWSRASMAVGAELLLVAAYAQTGVGPCHRRMNTPEVVRVRHFDPMA